MSNVMSAAMRLVKSCHVTIVTGIRMPASAGSFGIVNSAEKPFR